MLITGVSHWSAHPGCFKGFDHVKQLGWDSASKSLKPWLPAGKWWIALNEFHL